MAMGQILGFSICVIAITMVALRYECVTVNVNFNATSSALKILALEGIF